VRIVSSIEEPTAIRATAVDAGAHVDVDQIAWSDLEQPKGWPEGRRAGCPE